MAAAIVGGALLSAFFQVSLDKIISNEFLDFYRRRKLNVSLLGKMMMNLRKRDASRLWIAESLVHVTKSKKILEEVGDEFNLQGKLCISKLQNIVDPCDASQANTKKKEQIEDLSLEWDSCTAQESQHLVLEHLQPSTNLNKLTIKFYRGTWFPNWLDNINIINASNLFSELMLGLNSLEQLHIEAIPSRTTIPRDGLTETLKSSVPQKL
ncbi:hypothetical protein Ahy_A10g046909 [Arachis hypogaea]|uniref:R13L1/DRL21-like LRR repeat region domain-containing protein n=1 Tax=Arachis hypogaea TaxID=3818 RepID=A0A445B0Z9_ARAHY|nr:hypothetical protein Ahy_A10g046909 [Arachis hypogaea]